MLTSTLILGFLHAFAFFLVVCSTVGVVLTTVQVAISLRLLQRASARPDFCRSGGRCGCDTQPSVSSVGAPLVSILKPVSGLEDGLRDNLESFAKLHGVRYELIVSIADDQDPAIEVVRRALSLFPRGKAQLVIGRKKRVANPKVERLIAAAAVATGDIFFISDSNVRVSPDDLARTIAELDDPAVGCVSNPFVGQGGRSLGALLESLYLLVFVLPGNAFAAWAGVPCVVGKSMAITRRLYDILGGFEAFGQVLAEDQSIAVATKKAGYRVVLSPIVVSNVIERRSVRQLIQRQVRWGKMRYSFSKFLYSSELLVNPIPIILLACLAVALFEPASLLPMAVFGAAVSIVRISQSLVLMVASGARISKGAALLVPVQDIVQAVSQVAPYVSREVNWRGFRTRLGPDSLILAADHSSVTREYNPGILSST